MKRMSLICLTPVFLSCGFIIAHHENYEHTFIVSHTIKNETSDTVLLSYYRSSSNLLIAPNAYFTKNYSHLTSTTIPSSASILYGDSLSDSVQVLKSVNNNYSMLVVFNFDTLSYPSSKLINSKTGEEKFLYADTFNITASNFINGKRWVVIGKSIYE